MRDALIEQLAQPLQLRGAADDGAVLASREALDAGMHGEEAIGRNAFRLALQLERLDRLDGHGVAHQPEGELSDEHLVRACGLLEARRGVDRVAGNEALGGCRISRHHLPGVDPGPVGEANAVGSLELVVELGECGLGLERGADGAKSIVLVDAWQAEDGHDGVADELLDRRAVAAKDGSHRVEVAAHHLANRLRVECLPELGRALKVAEHDRHRASLFRRGDGRREGRAAVAAHAEAFGILFATARADLHCARF